METSITERETVLVVLSHPNMRSTSLMVQGLLLPPPLSMAALTAFSIYSLKKSGLIARTNAEITQTCIFWISVQFLVKKLRLKPNLTKF